MKPFLIFKVRGRSAGEIDKFGPWLRPISEKSRRACGLRLAEDTVTPFDLPGFDRSTVDGYAARARIYLAQAKTPRPCSMRGRLPNQAANAASCPGRRPGSLASLPAARCQRARLRGNDRIHARGQRWNNREVIRAAAPGGNIVYKDEDAARASLSFRAANCCAPRKSAFSPPLALKGNGYATSQGGDYFIRRRDGACEP